MNLALSHNDLAIQEPALLQNLVAIPSRGAGPAAASMNDRLMGLVHLAPAAFVPVSELTTLSEESLFDARLKAKLLIANVAMHISDAWRASLFKQLDDILDMDWDAEEPFPSATSTRTFLRMLIFLRFRKCPGLGVSRGNVVSAWTRDDDRLTIECLAGDRVQWIFSHLVDDSREIASGVTNVTRMPKVLEPYVSDSWVFE